LDVAAEAVGRAAWFGSDKDAGALRRYDFPFLRIEHGMKFSADRILTTHTGSLPRPPDLVALLNSKELGESYDRAAFSARVGRAILEIVRRQADAGIDIVDDGEHSKVNWMAYAWNASG